MKKLISSLLHIALLFSFASPVMAGECFSYPVEKLSGSGSISSAVYLRDKPCMEGSSKMTTLSSGTTVNVLGENDGWYQVEANGARGWIWESFLNSNAQETGESYPYDEYVRKYASTNKLESDVKKEGAKEETTVDKYEKATTVDSALLARTRGYIVLQVEDRGEAWYIDPVSARRYYMKDGPTAYQMMRSFGLGVAERDYDRMREGDYAMRARLRGRIVLRVQEHGEAYYIHPRTLELHYLKNGEEAYRIMRLHSLGITNKDLSRLTKDTIPMK